MPVYLAVALCADSSFRRLIMYETECEFAEVHNVMASLPKRSSAEVFERALDKAINLMKRIPPRDLPKLIRAYDKGSLESILDEGYEMNTKTGKHSSSISFLKPLSKFGRRALVNSDFVIAGQLADSGISSTGEEGTQRRGSRASLTKERKESVVVEYDEAKDKTVTGDEADDDDDDDDDESSITSDCDIWQDGIENNYSYAAAANGLAPTPKASFLFSQDLLFKIKSTTSDLSLSAILTGGSVLAISLAIVLPALVKLVQSWQS
jgi:hypothetical protein